MNHSQPGRPSNAGGRAPGAPTQAVDTVVSGDVGFFS
jgi:hypothetical protein